MRCYNSEEWAGFLYDENFDEEKKKRMKLHLKICDKCRKEVESLEKVIELLRTYGPSEEREDCPDAEILDAYRNGKLSRKKSKEIGEHLKICPLCREDMKLFERFPYPTEEAEKEIEKLGQYGTLDADLTKRLQDLYYLVYPPKIESISLQEKIMKRIKNLAMSLSNITAIFKLDLAPQPIYRGTERQLPQIFCSGGNILLSVSGETDIKVDLLDQHYNIIRTGKSDKLGQIWFKDIPQGEYFVKVKDHRVKITRL